jgi:hypothetical protein
MKGMEKQFDLILTDQRKAWWLALGVFGLLISITIGGFMTLARYGIDGIGLACIMVAYGGLLVLLFFWLPKKVGLLPMLVTVAQDKLTTLNRTSGEQRQVLFTDIVTYRFLKARGGIGLQLKLTDGRRVMLGINNANPAGQFLAMYAEFEKAVRRYEQQRGESPGRQGSNMFFAYPESTPILVFYAALLAVLTRMIGVPPSTDVSFYCLTVLYLGFVAYVVAWYSARKERRRN